MIFSEWILPTVQWTLIRAVSTYKSLESLQECRTNVTVIIKWVLKQAGAEKRFPKGGLGKVWKEPTLRDFLLRKRPSAKRDFLKFDLWWTLELRPHYQKPTDQPSTIIISNWEERKPLNNSDLYSNKTRWCRQREGFSRYDECHSVLLSYPCAVQIFFTLWAIVYSIFEVLNTVFENNNKWIINATNPFL